MTQVTPIAANSLKYDWTRAEVEALFALPFNDLLFQAQTRHREFFDPNEVQLSTLMSIKTGACPEDCSYCPQSAHYKTELPIEKLVAVDEVVKAAKRAKAAGASRFCMGAAWRSPKEKDLDKVIAMVQAVKDEGLETCVTLGMLEPGQAQRLKDNGLDYYNHNLDTSPEYYGNIISTRTYEDRLDTLQNVRDAGLNVCAGGIIGMGEATTDRAEMLRILATMNPHPESVPINALVKVAGTPLQVEEDLDPIEFVRMIAVTRILMPSSWVRLSAGRSDMTDEMQALCFLAGANSIFYGEKLLTTDNPEGDEDRALLNRLGIQSTHVTETSKVDCA